MLAGSRCDRRHQVRRSDHPMNESIRADGAAKEAAFNEREPSTSCRRTVSEEKGLYRTGRRTPQPGYSVNLQDGKPAAKMAAAGIGGKPSPRRRPGLVRILSHGTLCCWVADRRPLPPRAFPWRLSSEPPMASSFSAGPGCCPSRSYVFLVTATGEAGRRVDRVSLRPRTGAGLRTGSGAPVRTVKH